MFYSHEILTSRQYGVATIWLVATIGGKSNTKRLTRKAIQEVNVQRACEKILEPGAPIALRLQGSLLYGVSQVYNQQCTYMLADAQKIQGHMMTFVKTLGTNQLEPGAGRARQVLSRAIKENAIINEIVLIIYIYFRPESIMILDDPDFLPDPRIPELHPEMFILSQHTNMSSSQMSPRSSLSAAGSLGADGFHIHWDFGNSSASEPSGSLAHGLKGLSSAQKLEPIGYEGDGFNMENFAGSLDYGMEIDEFGNIIETGGLEPALPPFSYGSKAGQESQQAEQPKIDEQGDVMMMEEPPLPEAEAFTNRVRREDKVAPSSIVQNEHQAAPIQRRKKKGHGMQADDEIILPRIVLRQWQENYLDNCAKMKPRSVTATLAKRNAALLTFGLGIANIGQYLAIPNMIHPLTLQFSGDALFTAYTGLETSKKRGGKRARAAAGLNKDENGERRVRPRLNDTEEEVDQQGRGLEMGDDFSIIPRQEIPQSPPEVGRDPQSALDDQPSSTMPWNRGSSLQPGSSIRGPRTRDQPSSPLSKHGSVRDIIRYSDDVPMGGIDLNGFDDNGGLDIIRSPNSSFGFMPTSAIDSQKQTESQYTHRALDREGQNFLSYIKMTIHENGERRHDNDFERQYKWIDFDDVFVITKTDRPTAAQAFYHILTLVTKSEMMVEQDGANGTEPFGLIHIGMKQGSVA
ncbi:Rec8 like protein-domain-containing protein [Xylariales sp. PMI_506]|nr:Rec8 like protein-domain-containing protein [Xylariales sp. PMI_506]